MNLSGQLDLFLIALIAALIPVIPVAVGVLMAYLKLLENQALLLDKPTVDDVSTAIDRKIDELIKANGGTIHGVILEPGHGNGDSAD